MRTGISLVRDTEEEVKGLGAALEQEVGTGILRERVTAIFSNKCSAAAAVVVRVTGSLEVVALDPLSGQYDTNLRKIAHTLAELFSRTGKAAP